MKTNPNQSCVPRAVQHRDGGRSWNGGRGGRLGAEAYDERRSPQADTSTSSKLTEIVANVDIGNNSAYPISPEKENQLSPNYAQQTSNKRSSNSKKKKNKSGR
ncbi:hypothetical protein U1Q18_037489 [Sarracenia purpurea var. burkii]